MKTPEAEKTSNKRLRSRTQRNAESKPQRNHLEPFMFLGDDCDNTICDSDNPTALIFENLRTSDQKILDPVGTSNHSATISYKPQQRNSNEQHVAICSRCSFSANHIQTPTSRSKAVNSSEQLKSLVCFTLTRTTVQLESQGYPG